MSVVNVTQTFARNPATLYEAAQKRFEVLFDTLTENELDACTADDGTTAIPLVGVAYDDVTYTAYKAQRPMAKRMGKSPLFEVIVPYEIKDTTYSGNSGVSPLSRPTEWSTDGIPSTIDVDRDAAGNLLLNSAKQVLKTQIQHSDKYIRAVKNYSSLQNFDSYFNKANSAAYTIQGQEYGIETLWLSHITQDFVEELYDGEVIQYWRATFHFYAKIARGSDEPTKLWRFKILDRGTVKLDGTQTNGIRAIVDEDSIITAEVNLNGSGDVWNGSTPYFLNGASGFATAAVSNDYKQMYQTVDFTALSL